MLKDLLKEGGLYTLANLFTKGISFLLIPFYTAYFTPEDYGIYDMLVVFGVFAMNIFSLQLNQAVARFVSEPSYSEEQKIKYASTAFTVNSIMMLFFLIVSFLFADEIIAMLNLKGKLLKSTFYLSIVVVGLNNVFYFLNVYLRFIRKVMMVTTLSFLQTIFGILLLVYFVFQKDYGINSFFIPYIIVTPILLVVQIYVLKDRLKIFFDKTIFVEMIKYSTPLIAGALAMVVMNLTDRIFINEYIGESELGIYGIGIKFASIIGLVIGGFSTAIGPLIYEKHNKPETRNELGNLFNLFISIGVGGALILSLFSDFLVHNFTSVSYHKASTVLPIMFFTVFFTGFLMFSPGLQIKKKTLIISIITFVFASLNVLLNYLLIPKHGIMGAAYATLISTALFGIVYFKFSLIVYPFKVAFFKVLIPFLIALTSLYIVNKLKLEGVNYIFIRFVVIIVYIGIVFKIGLLNRLIKH